MTKTVTVKLPGGATVGAKTVEEVELREPRGGQLKGVSLAMLLQLEAGAIIKVLPRISEPAFSETEAAALSAPHLMAVGTRIVGFFATAEMKADLGIET